MKLPYLFCVSFWIIVYILKIATAQYCPDGEFTCTDGQCIEYERSCDGREDCTDGIDEFECDVKLEQVTESSVMKLKQFIFVGVMTAIFSGSQADYDCDEFMIRAEWHNVSDPADTLVTAQNVLGRAASFDDLCETKCLKKSKAIFDMGAVSRSSIPALCSSLCDCLEKD